MQELGSGNQRINRGFDAAQKGIEGPLEGNHLLFVFRPSPVDPRQLFPGSDIVGVGRQGPLQPLKGITAVLYGSLDQALGSLGPAQLLLAIFGQERSDRAPIAQAPPQGPQRLCRDRILLVQRTRAPIKSGHPIIDAMLICDLCQVAVDQRGRLGLELFGVALAIRNVVINVVVALGQASQSQLRSARRFGHLAQLEIQAHGIFRTIQRQIHDPGALQDIARFLFRIALQLGRLLQDRQQLIPALALAIGTGPGA